MANLLEGKLRNDLFLLFLEGILDSNLLHRNGLEPLLLILRVRLGRLHRTEGKEDEK